MSDLLPDEDADIRNEIRNVVKDSGRWLDTPNDVFGGVAPDKLIGTPDENLIRELIRRLKHGVTL